jgi:hypothetical protein
LTEVAWELAVVLGLIKKRSMQVVSSTANHTRAACTHHTITNGGEKKSNIKYEPISHSASLFDHGWDGGISNFSLYFGNDPYTLRAKQLMTICFASSACNARHTSTVTPNFRTTCGSLAIKLVTTVYNLIQTLAFGSSLYIR